MKLRINKACDLSSISVLPPRRTGGVNSSQGASQSQSHSQIRSQSQQSFSQGFSQSQLSQVSLDDNLLTDQRFNSNENSSRVVPPLTNVASNREESLQLSRGTNNLGPRWNSSSVRESKCQMNEEIEQRLRQLDGTVSRMGMILDAVQTDVMQISRAIKELSHENEGIRQKMVQSDNSLQQVLKGEDNIKVAIEESLKSICDLLAKNSNENKLNDISLTLSTLPDKVQVNFAKLHNEIIRLFSRETEIILKNIKSISSTETVPNQTTTSRPITETKPVGKGPVPVTKLPQPSNPTGNNWRAPVSQVKSLAPKLTTNYRTSSPQKEAQNIVISLDSDDESDGSASCLILKKETVENDGCWMKEAREDTLRILRKARKRKRKQIIKV